MAPRETENNAYAKFWVTNKEHYGMLWYFLEWSMGTFLLQKLQGWRRNEPTMYTRPPNELKITFSHRLPKQRPTLYFIVR